MTKAKDAADDLREPREVEIAEDMIQYECQWPGCEFDTLERVAFDAHVDPLRGRHREPIGAPGVSPQPLGADERVELETLRAFKEATDEKIAAGALVPGTTTTTTTPAPKKEG